MTLLQSIVLGQILGPRIFSKAVGVHPIVALFALFAGADRFGVESSSLSLLLACSKHTPRPNPPAARHQCEAI
jgi:predicted PurR-regulated permease PerM